MKRIFINSLCSNFKISKRYNTVRSIAAGNLKTGCHMVSHELDTELMQLFMAKQISITDK